MRSKKVELERIRLKYIKIRLKNMKLGNIKAKLKNIRHKLFFPKINKQKYLKLQLPSLSLVKLENIAKKPNLKDLALKK